MSVQKKMYGTLRGRDRPWTPPFRISSVVETETPRRPYTDRESTNIARKLYQVHSQFPPFIGILCHLGAHRVRDDIWGKVSRVRWVVYRDLPSRREVRRVTSLRRPGRTKK